MEAMSVHEERETRNEKNEHKYTHSTIAPTFQTRERDERSTDSDERRNEPQTLASGG